MVRLAAVRRLMTVPREQLKPAHQAAFDRALAEYRESQQPTLDRAHSHINLGWLAGQLGDPAQAAEEFRTAIRMEPYLTGPRTELANLLAIVGGDADEIRTLREAEAKLLARDAKLLPDSGDVYYRLGLLRYQLNDHDGAAAALSESCRLSPSNYDYRMALALLEERRYETSGDETHYEAAIDSLQRLQQMKPGDPRAGQIFERLQSTRATNKASR
jgi:tetratricopeptide (TPR) repeat protein